MAAISREDLDVKALGKYRVCSCHFLSGKPAALKDDTDIDWLPTINLGHSKRATRDSAEQAVMRVMRHERARRRRDMQRAKQQHISDNSMYFNVIQLQYENVLFVQLEF